MQYRTPEIRFPSREIEKDKSLKGRRFEQKTRNLLNLKF